MPAAGPVRLDKWLWAVRLFKTRSMAAAACTGGKVQIAGHSAKASRTVRIGEVIEATKEEITRTVEVVDIIDRRVPASVAVGCYKDLTPAAEYEKQRLPNFRPLLLRPKGAGRPTKKDRRAIDDLLS